MKPSTHNDPESWRRTDAALRRALQQRCSNAPQLPEGFYERLQQRMAQEAGQQKAAAQQEAAMLQVASAQQEAPALAQRSPRRKPAPALWRRTAAAAAAVLAIAAGLGTWYRRPISPSAPNTPDAPTMATAAIVASTPSVPAVTSTPSTPSVPTVVTATAHVTTTAATARPTTATAAVTTTAPTLAAAGTPTAATPPAPATPAETPPLPTPPTHKERMDKQVAQQPPSTPAVTATSTGKAGPEHTSAHQLLAMAVHIGTDGGGLGMPASEQDYAHMPQADADTKPINYYFPAANGYTYDLSSYSATASDADGSQPTAHAAPTRNAVPIANQSHRLPVTIGATLQVPLSGRLAIETGLTYTRLASTFDSGTSTDFLHQHQRIHYLGIPLRLQAQLLRAKGWRGYVAGGGSIELPVRSALSTQRISLTHHGTVQHSHPSAPVQFALGAGIGIQYDVLPSVGIYAEPSVQWFVPTGSTVRTYRTEHPLRFVPTVGLRWHMNK